MAPINTNDFYATYHGHDVAYLETVHSELRRVEDKSCIWLAGDSSLDNKFWFRDNAPAVNGYELLLAPPRMKQDVCYWLNAQAAERRLPYFCVNTAVEATALNDRSFNCLLPQDRFIRDNITGDDVLVVVAPMETANNDELMVVVDVWVGDASFGSVHRWRWGADAACGNDVPSTEGLLEYMALRLLAVNAHARRCFPWQTIEDAAATARWVVQCATARARAASRVMLIK